MNDACDPTGKANADAIANTKIAVWRARPKGEGNTWCYDASLDALAASVGDGAEPGSAYDFECIAMTRRAFEALPEFDGW